jgi:hypothetical protein
VVRSLSLSCVDRYTDVSFDQKIAWQLHSNPYDLALAAHILLYAIFFWFPFPFTRTSSRTGDADVQERDVLSLSASLEEARCGTSSLGVQSLSS